MKKTTFGIEGPEPVGDIIRDCALEVGLTEAQLRAKLKLPPEMMDALLEGRVLISDKVAARLARVTGKSRDFWLEVQGFWNDGQLRLQVMNVRGRDE